MQHTIVAFGEILWDMLPDGPVLGGAPLNFAFRTRELAHNSIVVSALGSDPLGYEAEARLHAMGLRSDFLQRTTRYPTGTVNVFINEFNQPDYQIRQNVAYDAILFQSDLEALAASVSCVCYGTLAQRRRPSRLTLHRFLDTAREAGTPLMFYDVNLRKDCFSRDLIERSLYRADVLKLNVGEARRLASMLHLKKISLMDIAQGLVEDWELEHCIVTMGAQGALCASKGGTSLYDPGYAVDLVDTSGAGDAFSAGFVHCLLHGRSAADGIRFGNVLGSIVASQHGPSRPITTALIERFVSVPPPRVPAPDFEFYLCKEALN